MIELDKIYNEDFLEGMKRIQDGSVDAIICDLPYGTTANKWDSIIPFDKLWEQYNRLIKPRGVIALFSQQPFTSALVMSNPDMFKYEWIWEKELGTGFLNANFAPLKIHENICIFSFGSASQTKTNENRIVYNPQYTKGDPYISKAGGTSENYRLERRVTKVNDGKRYPNDIIRFSRDSDSFHPTQKPVDLLRYLVRTYSDEGDTILDNCMGSGTTAIACIKENRHFIGFELNKEYYDKACKRIAAEKAQLTLF